MDGWMDGNSHHHWLTGSKLAGSWTQELEPGIEHRHCNGDAGLLTGILPISLNAWPCLMILHSTLRIYTVGIVAWNVKPLLGTPASRLGILGIKTYLCFRCSFLLVCQGGERGWARGLGSYHLGRRPGCRCQLLPLP